jgi:alpha-galactosidase
MLEVGNGGMKDNEYRMQMGLWSLLAAPLLAGNDLTKMSPETLAILTNSEVIAVDQDRLGQQAHRVWEEGPLEIWMKPLADGSKAVGLFNREQGTLKLTVRFRDIGVAEAATVRDVWKSKDLGLFHGSFSADVGQHQMMLLKIR